MNEKRFRKVMGFIRDNTLEGGDVEGVMDLTEIEDMLNSLSEENEKLKSQRQNDAKEFSALFKQNYGLKRENEQLKKEINMLKVTIGRNESYIERLTHQSNWHC